MSTPTFLSSVPRRPLLSHKLRPTAERSPDRPLKEGLSARLRQLLGLSVCQTHKVAPATAKDYTEVFAEVEEFVASTPGFIWEEPMVWEVSRWTL